MGVFRRGSHFITSDHSHALGQQIGVDAGGGGVGRHVHEYGIAQVAAEDELGEFGQRLGGGNGQLVGPGGQVKAFLVH